MINQLFSTYKSILSIFAILALTTVLGVTVYNNNAENTFQAQVSGVSIQEQFNIFKEFYNPDKFAQKLNAYKNSLINEIKGLYANGTFKTVSDVNKLRTKLYVFDNPSNPSRSGKPAFALTEYNCFFNMLASAAEQIDCPIQKAGKMGGILNFYGQINPKSPLRPEVIRIASAYVKWYTANVTPIMKATALKYKTQ